MPIYHFVCENGHEVERLLPRGADPGPCLECQCALKRVPGVGPSTIKKEILDNGVMRKSLERLADAERLSKERSQSSRDNK